MKCLIVGSSGSIGNYLQKYFKENKKNEVISLNRKRNKKDSKNNFYCNFLSNIEIKKKITKIYKIFGTIDIFISCIGSEGSITKKIYKNNIKNWKKNFDINLFSNIMIFNQILPLMKYGSLIFFSGGGTTSYPEGIKRNLIEYSCSKIALIKFIEIAASHLSQKKININILSPGPINSRMLRNIYRKGKKLLGKERKKIQEVFYNNNDLSHISKTIEFLYKHKSISGKIISTKYDNLKQVFKKRKEKNFYTLRIKK